MSFQDSPLEQRPAGDLVWRILLYALLLIQVFAMISFAVPRIFPSMTRWASVLYTVFGIASFFGLLLWCIESVHRRPVLTRFALRCVLVICLFWCVSPLLLPMLRKSDLGVERRDDVRRVFRELIADGTLSAPRPEDVFTIRSRHGTTFSISYTNAAGEPRHYFVSDGFERFWKFQNMADRSEVRRSAAFNPSSAV